MRCGHGEQVYYNFHGTIFWSCSACNVRGFVIYKDYIPMYDTILDTFLFALHDMIGTSSQHYYPCAA